MGAETEAQLQVMCAEEFVRLGAKWNVMVLAQHADTLARGLAIQEVELGEIGVMAACVGFMVGKGARF